MDEPELERRLHRAATHVQVPVPPELQRSAGWLRRAGTAALTVAVLAVILVAGQQLALWRGASVPVPSGVVAASGSASQTPSASPAATLTPTPSAPPLAESFERVVLGYRIELPVGLRNSDCLSGVGGGDGRLGADTFTLLSPEQERAKDLAEVARGGEPVMWTFQVTLYRSDGMSALELAARGGCPLCDPNTSAQLGSTVEPLMLNGYEAARVTIAGESRQFVLRAAERLYVIELYFNTSFVDRVPRPSVLPAGILDAVAPTFQVRPLGPIATATPVPSNPPPSVREAAAALGTALAAGNVDALTGVATPRCWLQVSAPASGPVGRAVEAYLAELRQRFAAGLRVTVDPTVRQAQAAGPGGAYYFVRSDWLESGQTTQAELYLSEVDGRWVWSGSQFHAPGQ